MSWQSYVENLMADGICQDAAIVGYTDSKYVWASCPGGVLANLTCEEIDQLMSKEHSKMFTQGLTVGQKKCSLIRDSLHDDNDCTADIRTKSQAGEPTCNLSIGRAGKVFVCVMGKEGVHGGKLNQKAHCMAEHLRKCGY